MLNDYLIYTQHIPLSLLNILISLIILRVAYHRRQDIRGIRSFLLLMTFLIIRSTVIIPTFANDNADNLLFWQNVQWPINLIIVTLWFVVAIRYTGIVRYMTIRRYLPLVVIPVIASVMVLLDGELGLIRADYAVIVQQGLPELSFVPGVLHLPFTAYIYGLAIIGVLLVFRYSFASPGVNRRLASVVLFSVIVIIFVYAMQFSINLHPAYLPQMVIFIVQFVLVVGILRTGFLQFHPIARPLLMLAMQDGFILIDHFDRITDMNEQAA